MMKERMPHPWESTLEQRILFTPLKFILYGAFCRIVQPTEPVLVPGPRRAEVDLGVGFHRFGLSALFHGGTDQQARLLEFHGRRVEMRGRWRSRSGKIILYIYFLEVLG